MSTPAFNFDLSALSPLISGLGSRAMSAMDYRLAQMPVQDRLNRRAYAEWLTNNASKRDIAEGEFALRKKGADAATALQSASLKYGKEQEAKADMEKRAAYQAMTNRWSGYTPGVQSSGTGSPGAIADFYQYGPYAYGGRGGGGSAAGGRGEGTDDRGLWTDSSAWQAENCRRNPSAPGCPGGGASR